MNTYGYADQNPLTKFDPDGRLVVIGLPIYIWVAGGAAVGARAVCVGTDCGQAASDALSGLGGNIAGAVINYYGDKPERTDEEELWAVDLRDEYKADCNRIPPKTGDICYDLKNEIRFHEQCMALRQAWDDSFWPGRHAQNIKESKRALKKLRTRLKNSTCEDKNCPPIEDFL